MIDPVKPYAIRGAIWYQGESNGPTADIYADMMRTLITTWRGAWGEGDFPFYQVQLAFHNKPVDDPVQVRSETAQIRDAQRISSKTIPNCEMATAVDIGDVSSIHPKNKQEVGRRLALIAENRVFGESEVEYSGPQYESMAVEGNAIRLKFSHVAGGLTVHGAGLTGFAVTSDGKTWFNSTARIDGDCVIVSSDAAPKPIAARYAWADNPPISLYNAAGLPASPFKRTPHNRPRKEPLADEVQRFR